MKQATRKYAWQLIIINFDSLYEEFVDYQTITNYSIGESVWQEAKVIDSKDEDGYEKVHYRIDILWWHLAHLKVPDPHLPKVAEIVLIIPHSNAEQERLFSIV